MRGVETVAAALDFNRNLKMRRNAGEGKVMFNEGLTPEIRLAEKKEPRKAALES